MDFTLTDLEIRVLGSLVEKEATTPEYYPLTLNALVTACNQKTNREPVVEYDENAVRDTLLNLKAKDLVIVCEGSRVFRYDNYLAEKLELSKAEAAVMCILMLRGPQTPGEIRSRADRLHTFDELSDVEATLDGLASRGLAVKLARQPGRKEHRYAHLLSGEVDVEEAEDMPNSADQGLIDRIEQLEADFAALRGEFAEFRKQFE